jgi:glycosyltransferase involved in cell wall biosynthesis
VWSPRPGRERERAPGRSVRGVKIVHVIHTFPPFSRAGSENYVDVLAREQAQRHEVAIFHRVEQTDRPEYELSDDLQGGLPVTRVNRTFRDVGDFADTYRSDAVAAAFGSFLDRLEPDVVHFHHVTCLSTTCVHEAHRRGIPVVFTLHDFWLLCPRGQLLRRDLSLCESHTDADCVRCMAHQLRVRGGHPRVDALWRRAEWIAQLPLPASVSRRLVGRAFAREEDAARQIQERTAHVRETCSLVDAFVAPSRFLKDRYVDFGIPPERVTVSDYGFDLDRAGAMKRTERRPGERLRFAYLGTWIPSKGVHILVEAFRHIEPERARLEIHGYAPAYDGVEDYEGELRRLAAGATHIDFVGSYEPEDLNAILARADVLVVPSIWYENSPLTIHEAFLAGVPVIVSDLGGMRELVQDGGGARFEPRNALALRAALEKVIDDPEHLADLRRSLPAVKGIGEDAGQLEELYRSIGVRCE